MRRRLSVVVYHQPDRLAFSEIVNVRFGRESSIAELCLEEDRVIVVGSKCRIVHVKQVVSSVALKRNSYVLHRIRFGRCQTVVRYCPVNRFLELRMGRPSRSRWRL